MKWRTVTRTAVYRALPRDSAARVYLRIMEASERGRGVVLSPDEVLSCSLDHAVEQAAAQAMQLEED